MRLNSPAYYKVPDAVWTTRRWAPTSALPPSARAGGKKRRLVYRCSREIQPSKPAIANGVKFGRVVRVLGTVAIAPTGSAPDILALIAKPAQAHRLGVTRAARRLPFGMAERRIVIEHGPYLVRAMLDLDQ